MLSLNNQQLEYPKTEGNSNTFMNQINKELEKCKYKAFGKVNANTATESKESDILMKQKMLSTNRDGEDKIEKQIEEAIRKEQATKLDKELKTLNMLKRRKERPPSYSQLKQT